MPPVLVRAQDKAKVLQRPDKAGGMVEVGPLVTLIRHEYSQRETGQHRVEEPIKIQRQKEQGQATDAACAVHLDEIVPGHRLGLGMVLAEWTDEGGAHHGRTHTAEGIQRPVHEPAEEVGEQPAAQGSDREEGGHFDFFYRNAQ